VSGATYQGVILEGSTYCTNSWSVSGTETTPCPGCDYAFDVQHRVSSEECGSSSDFDWTVGWPYEYHGYDLIAVESGGRWYPYGWVATSTSSELYWYRVSETYTYGSYEYYWFLVGDYSIY